MLKSWEEFNFKCTGCGSCCALYLNLTIFDIWRVANSLNTDIRNFIRFDSKYKIVDFKRDSSNNCMFLDENRRCKIYPVRPMICRFWPFLFNKGNEIHWETRLIPFIEKRCHFTSLSSDKNDMEKCEQKYKEVKHYLNKGYEEFIEYTKLLYIWRKKTKLTVSIDSFDDFLFFLQEYKNKCTISNHDFVQDTSNKPDTMKDTNWYRKFRQKL